MKCQDVRRTLSLFVDGQLALTEWAIIQGHLLECAECRKELDRHRALAGVRARARLRRTTAMTAAAMAVVLAVAAVGGVFIYRGSVPDLPSWATPAPPPAAIPPAPAPEPVAPVTGAGPVRAALASAPARQGNRRGDAVGYGASRSRPRARRARPPPPRRPPRTACPPRRPARPRW